MKIVLQQSLHTNSTAQHINTLYTVSVMATATVHPSLTDQIVNPSSAPTPQLGFLPFLKQTYPGFGYPSKLTRPICSAYKAGHCPLGPACPDRHYTPPNERSGIGHLICKHYQRGLCKKGDACEFAHTFDLRGERECKEFSRYGICPQGDDCKCCFCFCCSDGPVASVLCAGHADAMT